MARMNTQAGYVKPRFSDWRPSGTGSVTRIYLNAAGDTIGLDEIGIQFYSAQKVNLSPVPHDNELVVTGKISQVNRTLIHEGAGARVIVTIKQIGDYDSVTVDGGDFLSAIWIFGSNNCDMVFTAQVAQVGDTI